MNTVILPAGVHRLPEHVSTGRALNWVTRGQPLTRNPGRAGQLNQLLLPGVRETGGRVERVGSATASFIRSEAA